MSCGTKLLVRLLLIIQLAYCNFIAQLIGRTLPSPSFGILEHLKPLVDRLEAFFVEQSIVDLTATRCSGASSSILSNNPS